jgi:hypothetical protein
MTSLADLFNPTFLMFLGILVLVIALLVVYFESKMREQNHKIASMLSLVSTLAEDMNGVKMGINHLAIRGGNSQNISLEENLGISKMNRLIEVSDDEGSDDEGSDDEGSDDEGSDDEYEDLKEESDDDKEFVLEEESESDNEDEQSDDELEEEDEIKVIKLQVSNEDTEDVNLYQDADNLDFDASEDLDDFNINDEIPEIAEDYVEEILSLKYDEKPEENIKHLEEHSILSTNELKTISINLGDDTQETIDYKKLQLPKLRSIAVEKGLTTNTEALKLKKPELLKLLGSE